MSFIGENVLFLRKLAMLPGAFRESAFSHNLVKHRLSLFVQEQPLNTYVHR
jgi:hypothetical protein